MKCLLQKNSFVLFFLHFYYQNLIFFMHFSIEIFMYFERVGGDLIKLNKKHLKNVYLS